MSDKKKTSSPVHLVAGGTAGLCEALACHPLDTIKVRMQLSTRARLPGVRLVARAFAESLLMVSRQRSEDSSLSAATLSKRNLHLPCIKVLELLLQVSCQRWQFDSPLSRHTKVS